MADFDKFREDDEEEEDEEDEEELWLRIAREKEKLRKQEEEW